MEQDGPAIRRVEAHESSSTTPTARTGTPRDGGATGPLADPMEFFRPTNTHEALADYAKSQAIRGTPATIVRTWATALHAETFLWVIFPILTAGTLLWQMAPPVHPSRLIFLSVGALATLGGLNLLRDVARQASPHHPLAELVRTSRPAQIGIVLTAFGLLLGLFAPRWIGPGNIGLGVVGLALALAYLALGMTGRSVPGEELLPAIALGPVLFLLALSTQTVAAHPPSTALAHSEKWLALAFGGLFFAAVVAKHLGQTAEGTSATRNLIGESAIRLLVIIGLAVAYGGALIAGLGRGTPHATVAVLLTLPVAILPLTSTLVGRTAAALKVVAPQMQRTILWFGLCLVGALILGGIYLHVIAALHSALAK
jgi:hypothetical protein